MKFGICDTYNMFCAKYVQKQFLHKIVSYVNSFQ